MLMKFQILRNVPAKSVASRIRRAFRDRIRLGLEHPPCTLIVFRFQRDERESGVVTLNTVKQALDRLGVAREQQVLALAGDFTEEARGLLKANKIEAVTLTYFGWTEETYKAIKSPKSN